MKKILHLCADIGSDSAIYFDMGYEVIKVGKEIGVGGNGLVPQLAYEIFKLINNYEYA